MANARQALRGEKETIKEAAEAAFRMILVEQQKEKLQ
jgi:hypothetical protein